MGGEYGRCGHSRDIMGRQGQDQMEIEDWILNVFSHVKGSNSVMNFFKLKESN